MDDIRARIEDSEERLLARYASRSASSRGRELPEDLHPFRTAFQRDRDRILHSKAFRRLAHKTQVFLAPEGDHYRVRLTHTLEVTQIARTIARALRLNEDLAEAICLGHDLGHTPYGHLGEEVLTEFLGRQFRHNEQSLRIVDKLERRGDRHGLNLTWEVRDGILNHTWSMPDPATPEAKVARFADRIAYISHDIDDALRAGVLVETDLPSATSRVLGRNSSGRIDTMVASVVKASGGGDVEMESDILDVLIETREFLYKKVYTRPEVQAEHDRARALLRALCDHYEAHPEELPAGDDEAEIRMIDYIAGMTDRFARREYERIMRAGAQLRS
jgi:dGTPase